MLSADEEFRKNAAMPHAPGSVQAEDGSWVPPSFYAPRPTVPKAQPQSPLFLGGLQQRGAAAWPEQAPTQRAAPPSPAKTVATILPALDQRAATQPGIAYKGATVVGDAGKPEDTQVRLDGDATAVGVPSIIGNLKTGDRVMVALVPPQGAYVIGWAAIPGRYTLRTTELATTWTVGGVPLTIACDWRYTDEAWIEADYHVTLAGAPAGGTLVVDLPVPSSYGNFPHGICRLGGTMNFNASGAAVYNCMCRTGGAQVSWFIEDPPANLLASGHAGAAGSIAAHISYRPSR